jgi:hypothetical protein
MRINQTLFLALTLVTLFLYSCNKKQLNNQEQNTKTVDHITKRSSNFKKIAYGDIEFGMTAKELAQTNTFKGLVMSKESSEHPITLENKMKQIITFDRNDNKYIDRINRNIKQASKLERIGNNNYTVVTSLYKDAVFIVCIYADYDFKNIKDIITLKYGKAIEYKKQNIILTKHAQKEIKSVRNSGAAMESLIALKYSVPKISDCAIIPKTYCLFEWKTKTKNIKIYNCFRSTNSNKAAGSNGWTEPTVEQTFVVEIYNDSIINMVIDDCKRDLEKNKFREKQKEHAIQAKEAIKF